MFNFFFSFFHLTVGHGQSDGERVQIDKVETYVRDVLQHVDLMTSQHAGLPVFLFGHSMVSKIFEKQLHVQYSTGNHQIVQFVGDHNQAGRQAGGCAGCVRTPKEPNGPPDGIVKDLK